MEQLNQAALRNATELQTAMAGASEEETTMIGKDLNTLADLIKEVKKNVKDLETHYKYEVNTALRRDYDLMMPSWMPVREALWRCADPNQYGTKCSGFTFEHDPRDLNLDTVVHVYTKKPRRGPFGPHTPSVGADGWHSFTKR